MLGGQQWIADVVAPPLLQWGRPETLPANNITGVQNWRKSAILLKRDQFDPKSQVEGVNIG